MLGVRSLPAKLSRRYHLWRLRPALRKPYALGELFQLQLTRDEWYDYALFYFEHFLPDAIRQHRRYFVLDRRGFGEDAFHAMWWLAFAHFRPRKVLEIGVYRGQTITLWKLLAKQIGFECEVSCVSPFSAAGDAVSQYHNGLDYYTDVSHHHRYFELPSPRVLKGYSTSPAAAQFIGKEKWDCIYIDGNHDYDVVKNDWRVCSAALSAEGFIVLDDAGLGTEYEPALFATGGHPGPSRLAAEIDSQSFVEICSVGHNRIFQRAANAPARVDLEIKQAGQSPAMQD